MIALGAPALSCFPRRSGIPHIRIVTQTVDREPSKKRGSRGAPRMLPPPLGERGGHPHSPKNSNRVFGIQRNSAKENLNFFKSVPETLLHLFFSRDCRIILMVQMRLSPFFFQESPSLTATGKPIRKDSSILFPGIHSGDSGWPGRTANRSSSAKNAEVFFFKDSLHFTESSNRNL